MTMTKPAPAQLAGGLRDHTTRYLCAAVHTFPGFADQAIREFLTEPLRAIPPSPGVDTPTVLREAVAARRRRQFRDWLLLVILIAFGIVSHAAIIGWVVVGLVFTLAGVVRQPGREAGYGNVRAAQVLLFVIMVIALVTALFLVPIGEILALAQLGPLALVFGLLALAVVVTDEVVMWQLLTKSFRRGQFVPLPETDSWPGERLMRSLGQERFAERLRRITEMARTGNLIAYRGYSPFVGAGKHYEPFSMAISLEPAEESDEPDPRPEDDPDWRPFSVMDLYNHVSSALGTLRDSPSLAPSDRLSGMTERAQIVVPVAELLANLDTPEAGAVLPDLNQPPNQTIPPHQLAELAEHPREWLRYYRVFQIETWHRDLTLSVYLHFGINERTLYLEWTPCVLLPIVPAYRAVDRINPTGFELLWRGLMAFLELPVRLLTRLLWLFTRIRPARGSRGMLRPEAYGSSVSLRELAADANVQNYFQLLDVERYQKVLQGRLTRAIGEFLEAHDISVTEFMRQAEAVVNNFIGNDQVNVAIGNKNRISNNRLTKRRG